ncbi:MAG: DUF2384 domain-containing protein [Xanthomonadales bacterium]|nr:DUF2384 domain-containing protein [Xanthomonadales bacterium]
MHAALPLPIHELNRDALHLLGLRGRKGSTAREAAEVTAGQLTWRGLEIFRKRMAQNRPAFAATIDVSERTLARRAEDSANVDRSIAERALRIARIVALAAFVLEDDGDGLAWLGAPQPGLAGKVPMDLVASEFGAREVEELLLRIEHGIYV